MQLKNRFIFVPGEKMFLSGPLRPIQRSIHGFNTTTNDAAIARIVKKLTWASGSQTTLISRLEVLFDNFLFDSNSIYIILEQFTGRAYPRKRGGESKHFLYARWRMDGGTWRMDGGRCRMNGEGGEWRGKVGNG